MKEELFKDENNLLRSAEGWRCGSSGRVTV
jgi:hypothetical protein